MRDQKQTPLSKDNVQKYLTENYPLLTQLSKQITTENDETPPSLLDGLLEDTKEDDVCDKVAERIFAMIDPTKLSEPSDT